MRRFLAGISTCAAALPPLAAAFLALPSVPEVALSDASGSDAALHAPPPVPACDWDDLVIHPSDPSAPSAGEAPCGEMLRALGEIAEARAYLVETASPGYTMTLQGPEVAIGRLASASPDRLKRSYGTGLPPRTAWYVPMARATARSGIIANPRA